MTKCCNYKNEKFERVDVAAVFSILCYIYVNNNNAIGMLVYDYLY